MMFREVRRGTSPTSESGSDAWGANEGRPTQWDKQNWESTEFKKSGWDEPDSMERFNNTKEKKPRKRSEGEQWDSAPRTQVKKPAQGKHKISSYGNPVRPHLDRSVMVPF